MATQQWNAGLYEAKHSFVWKLGAGLIEQLNPQAGQSIIDLGCGSGQLTAKIAESGASVLGIDASPEMIGQARQNYPDLQFLLADISDFRLDQPVDAAFSNAALHWVRDAADAARCIHAALRPGGRFVAELGGQGNTAAVLGALTGALSRRGIHFEHPWYFPGLIEYATLLETNGFTVRSISLFDRPTPLEDGQKGLRYWLEMFAASALKPLSRVDQEAVLSEVESELSPALFREGTWYVDYRRLRVEAIRI